MEAAFGTRSLSRAQSAAAACWSTRRAEIQTLPPGYSTPSNFHTNAASVFWQAALAGGDLVRRTQFSNPISRILLSRVLYEPRRVVPRPKSCSICRRAARLRFLSVCPDSRRGGSASSHRCCPNCGTVDPSNTSNTVTAIRRPECCARLGSCKADATQYRDQDLTSSFLMPSPDGRQTGSWPETGL